MNTFLKTGFAITLFAICFLGLNTMTAEPVLAETAYPSCPSIECAPGEVEAKNMTLAGRCCLFVAGSYWSDCDYYSVNYGPITYSCYCDCDY